MDGKHQIPYLQFQDFNTLPVQEKTLAAAAQDATQLSYAPYSHFKVGAALLLEDGTIIKGGNQENASFSLTICAERTALSTYSATNATQKITTIAIAYQAANKKPEAILSPCGACRQHILEYQMRQAQPIAIIMTAPDGSGIRVASVTDLLPFAFTGDTL